MKTLIPSTSLFLFFLTGSSTFFLNTKCNISSSSEEEVYDLVGFDRHEYEIHKNRSIKDEEKRKDRSSYHKGNRKEANKKYNKKGYDDLGIHKDTGTRYNPEGYDEKGFDQDGIHKDTGTRYDEYGYDRDGKARSICNSILTNFFVISTITGIALGAALAALVTINKR